MSDAHGFSAMTRLFHRELASYAASHRDPVNGIMHIVGNPILFVAVVLPLSLLSVTVFGVPVSVAPLLVVPALGLWSAFDLGIGLALSASAIPLLWVAALIARHTSLTGLWTISIVLFVLGWVLQIVGHQMFEHKRPSLLDDPLHMLISPMYIFAKLYVALGFRPDLAAILRDRPHDAPVAYASEDRADVGRFP